jgi:hypothetical protein
MGVGKINNLQRGKGLAVDAARNPIQVTGQST